jgi:hypothetical protein
MGEEINKELEDEIEEENDNGFKVINLIVKKLN